MVYENELKTKALVRKISNTLEAKTLQEGLGEMFVSMVFLFGCALSVSCSVIHFAVPFDCIFLQVGRFWTFFLVSGRAQVWRIYLGCNIGLPAVFYMGCKIGSFCAFFW